jgi:hypothetical protein
VNIFYVDESPIDAAQALVDKHVVKMILESAQLLSTAHRVLDGEKYIGKFNGRKHTSWILPDARDGVMYAATHMNHPSAVWCRQSIENYNWLVDHFYELGWEYTHRYGKTHKCLQGELAYMLQSPPNNLKEYNWTPMPSCMALEYIISENPLTNYRNYYRMGKSNLHKWTNRQPPEWINA